MRSIFAWVEEGAGEGGRRRGGMRKKNENKAESLSWDCSVLILAKQCYVSVRTTVCSAMNTAVVVVVSNNARAWARRCLGLVAVEETRKVKN